VNRRGAEPQRKKMKAEKLRFKFDEWGLVPLSPDVELVAIP
jgi:hypothetical protein